MSCGMSHAQTVPQALVDQRPVFEGHKHRKTVYSRKSGVYRPSKKVKRARFL